MINTESQSRLALCNSDSHNGLSYAIASNSDPALLVLVKFLLAHFASFLPHLHPGYIIVGSRELLGRARFDVRSFAVGGNDADNLLRYSTLFGCTPSPSKVYTESILF